MTTLGAMQGRFADALRDPGQPLPDGLVSWNCDRPERRFAIYRNNVAVGLGGALASRFPVAEKLVGTAFFAAMAQAYVRAHPPRSPLLLNYGDDFADFVAHYGPAAEVAYLSDIVRLEAARGKAYHAADAPPLDPTCLAAVAADDLPTLRFTFHPAAALVRSTHPVVTIWAMNAGELELSPIEPWVGEDAIVTRPELIVLVRRLPPGGAAFIAELMTGAPLAPAIAVAQSASSDFDLTANLAGLLQCGALVAIA